MAEPKWDRDEFDRLWRRIEDLQKHIRAIENDARPTVPIYDPAQFPLQAVEGQIALGDDEKAYKYQNGAWSQMGGSGIMFDTYPQAGGNLYAEAVGNPGYAPWYPDVGTRFPNMPSGMSNSEGFLFVADNATDFGVYVNGGTMNLIADQIAHSVINMQSWEYFGNITYWTLDTSETYINGYDYLSLTGNGNVFIAGNVIVLRLNPAGGASRFEVQNHSGVRVFTVDQDGSVHGLASVGAIAWDL